MYFTGDGWLRFIRAHKLREGYFLVFCYKGNALFKFRVYDLSACDITSYASIDAHDDNGNENVKVNTKSKNISKQRKMKEKIRVIEVADEDEFEEDDGDKEREITEKEEQEKKKVLEVRLKKEKAILKEGYEKENKESIDEKKMVKRRKKISEVKIEEEHEELIPKRKRKTSGGKTSESDEPSIKRCMNSGYTEMMNRNNSSPPRGINKFEVSIWPCNLVHPYLNIPAKFRAANGLTEYNSLTLMDPKGRSWQVQLRHKTNKFESRTSMTTGWNKFASANELKQGDKCIFELGSEENNGILLMKVSIKKKESIDKKKMKEKKKMSGVKFGGEHAILKEGYEKENKESIDEKKMVKRRKKISEVKIEEEHVQSCNILACSHVTSFSFFSEELIPKRKRKTSGGKTSESDEPSIKRCMNLGYTEMMNRNNSSPPRGINKFEVPIWPSNLVQPYMNIPAKFRAANGLTEYNSLTLMDPKGRSWQVQLRHRTNKFQSRTSMTTGWNKFAFANELKQGDKCIFELGSEENNGILLMKVSIKKKESIDKKKMKEKNILLMKVSIKKKESIDKKKMKEKNKMSGVKFGGEHGDKCVFKLGSKESNGLVQYGRKYLDDLASFSSSSSGFG
ncbi:uncharacterized protein A4U43_C08F12680 [Asparagus officinalis]|nr:uncharacterized protein A4U43_C08F12680 [Asparagus officinalis]